MESGDRDLHAACRERFAAPEAIIAELQRRDAEKQRRIEELEARLNQNSRNSSRPPSTDQDALDEDLRRYRGNNDSRPQGVEVERTKEKKVRLGRRLI